MILRWMMRRPTRWLALILAVGPLSAAAPAIAQSKDEREVRAVLQRLFDFANSTDEKLAQRNLADHSRAGGPYYMPFGDPLSSTAELEALAVQNRGQLKARSYQATAPIRVRVEKKMAWAAYTWRAEFTLNDGTQHNYEGRTTATFIKEGKDWKFVHWHSSVAAPAPLDASARAAETEKILATERSAYEAIKSRNAKLLADYFADDATILAEGSAYRTSGKPSLLANVANLLARSELRSYQMLEPQVQLSGDTAVLTYYFDELWFGGGRETPVTGKATVVFVKRGGRWQMLHEHRSLNR